MTERTKGTLPISVGTALAIEALPSVPMHRYGALLINLRTIIRNARQAYDDYVPTVKELTQATKEDIVGIAEAIVAMKIKTVLELKFYYPSYLSLPKLFPMAKLKNVMLDGNDNQKKLARLDKEVAENILKEFGTAINKVDSRIPEFTQEALIITNHPVDLVLTNSYARLNLLESHTGAIKNYTLFYTKLTGSDKFNNIPFNKMTIQIFGDKSTNFYSQNTGVKNEIKQLADLARWSSASSPSLVARSIRSLGDTPEKQILLKMI